jgi:VanZ family protein
MKSTLLRLLLVILWSATIFLLSVIPKNVDFLPPGIWGAISQKPPLTFSWSVLISSMVHMFTFMILAFLLARLFTGNKRTTLFPWGAALVLSLLIGLGDELYQRFIPERGFEMNDIFLDAIGALIGLGLFYVWNRQSPWMMNEISDQQDNWSKLS